MSDTFVYANGPHSFRRRNVGEIVEGDLEQALVFDTDDYDERVWPQ